MTQPIHSTNTNIEISWQRWPLREQGPVGWLRAGLVVLLVAGLWLVLLISLPPIAALLLGVAFAGFLLPYFLPTSYVLSSEGIQIQRGVLPARLKPWQNFVEARPNETGYWLLPAQPAPAQSLTPLRALFLPYPLDSQLKSTFISIIAHHFPPQFK